MSTDDLMRYATRLALAGAQHSILSADPPKVIDLAAARRARAARKIIPDRDQAD
jgi:hypothetical protein